MARDIKKMFENYTPETSELPKGHEARFEAKLNKAFSETVCEEKDTSFPWLKIAAVAIVFLAVSFFGYQQLSKKDLEITENTINSVVENNPENLEKNDAPKLTLANLSPDLKKVEEYYMTGINLQLASLKINGENKEFVEGYMQRLSELDKEYTLLNAELNQVGPSEATVTALIDNLKMRLDLLFKLKSKLKELKNQNNEEFKAIQT
ncbi:hypothetical protein [Aequorivita sp. CIP111184]|uniref:hypothetical protein n=1 Tax=Aequorivita sp. CIP111184 TaxID=2211356 RepID=UPI000DBC2978|nr:hypothetical protein [Aequorivita sp. CIP111184]SRX53933.1 hypothetical protein AEQU1_00996 [Aequorivita sp. CIP111184]